MHQFRIGFFIGGNGWRRGYGGGRGTVKVRGWTGPALPGLQHEAWKVSLMTGSMREKYVSPIEHLEHKSADG